MPPKKIKGRYEVRSVLGEGGMGVVYRAYDPPPMNREVALKTLLEFPDRMSLQLFYKECEVLKSMSHPNIVEIFDIGEFEDGGTRKPFFVMPLLPGQALDVLIKTSSHRLTVERVVDIISQTCRGLQAAHERGLIHRDLKPSNIFVMQDDSVKIIDFGVAHVVDSRTRSSGFQKGTLLYMAPEQIQFKPVSPQSDIFSLGVVCYEALTRRQPFRGASEEEITTAILKTIPPPASEINPAVNQLISRVVHKAMAKQPWHRFDNARDFGDALQKALRNQPIEIFDPARIQPRIQRATKALDSGDYQFASEIVGELEAEGNIDPQLTLLRTQIDQVVRQRTISQLLESARARFEEEEDPLALQKIQDVLEIDPNNVAGLTLKSRIDDRRSERQIEKWIRLARQHVDNHAYGPAHEAVQNALQLRASEPRALRLLSEIEAQEKDYLRIRQQKAQVYQDALNSWKNGEVSEALSHMGVVLELDRQAPDTSSPDTSKSYQTFYDKLRSEHDAITNAYADARRALSDHDFAKALKICQDSLAKYPNQALFQALKFDVEEQQRQQLSAFIAETDRKLEAEADLDVKVSLLREALGSYPGEPHFERSLRLISDKRDLVNSIVARSRAHEQRGQIVEAINDLETLRTIYAPYPGLQFEVDRLLKRREKVARDSAKSRWIEQVDRQLGTGNYLAALEVLQKAEIEFPDDTELLELEKHAREGQERAVQAEQLLAQGQELCQQGNLDKALELYRQARQLDERNPVIRSALRDVLVDRARAALDSDWRSAGALADQALELDPNHALARSIRSQVLDRKRDQDVDQVASRARRLQAAGDLNSAVGEVEKGLSAYPAEPRLSAIHQTLNREISHAQRNRARLQDFEQARELQNEAVAAPNPDQLASIYERSRVYAEKYPEEPELQSIAREVERIVKARGERPPTPKPITPKPKTPAPKPKTAPATPSGGTRTKGLPFLKPALIAAGSIVFLVVIVVMVRRFWPVHPIGPAAVHVQIHTLPQGATLQIRGQDHVSPDGQIDLPPGDYQVQASLPGYETSSNTLTVRPGSPTDLEIRLRPLSQELRVFSPDFADGQVSLDDNAVGSLESGTVIVPSLAPGQHQLRVASTKAGQDATVQFQERPGAPFSVSPSLPTHQLQIVVISTNSGTAQLKSSLIGASVTVDDNPKGQLGTDGLEIDGLAAGTHSLVLGTSTGPRRVSFEVGPAPALDAIVFSDRDVGSLLVTTGQDGTDVFLDGKPYPRKTQAGQLRIPNLKTQQHTIRVHKDGFKDPADQAIAISKGQEAAVRFALEALPKMATLSLDHLPAGTQIALDDAPLGQVNPDGSLSRSGISPGQHTVSFAVPGYLPQKVQRKFGAGDIIRMSTAEVELKRAPAVLDVAAASNISVTIEQNGHVVRQFTGPSKVSLDEGSYTVVGRGANGATGSSTVSLASGETKTVNIRLTAASNAMERWEHPEKWKLEDGWYGQRGGGFVLYQVPPGPASYVFALRWRHGHSPFSSGGRLRWVLAYVDDRNYVEIQVDGKFLYRTEIIDGTKHEEPKVEHHIPDNAPLVTFSVDIAPTTLVQRFSIPNGPWQMMNTWERQKGPSLYAGKTRGFTDGKFGFLIPSDRGLEMSNFAYYPKTK
ncbi:MAG: protein kinase [Candidatus Sulfotelmatobacter sp.]